MSEPSEWYVNGFALGRVHAKGTSNIDPRNSFAHASKMGQLAEFERGFNDGYNSVGADK